ncbi:hypothetical protein BT96DRAFT_1004984 [Gymnopus androsaceus JB14]|uniref:Uncharacterized protein n=1 Tax=Gymnopus androsaceus JB14 TaxID=1447944 RepID=A0A6A4GPN0_9AGAR|nr:hypothetical protein BT96DRAFT_1004984 [Gymnopus androsaceus JB14]
MSNNQLVLNTDGIHPWVNAKLLPRFIDRFVVLPSKVIEQFPDTRTMLVEACDGQAVQVDVQRLLENARIVSIALELSLIVSKFPVTMFVDVLGQAYREAGGKYYLVSNQNHKSW